MHGILASTQDLTLEGGSYVAPIHQQLVTHSAPAQPRAHPTWCSGGHCVKRLRHSPSQHDCRAAVLRIAGASRPPTALYASVDDIQPIPVHRHGGEDPLVAARGGNKVVEVIDEHLHGQVESDSKPSACN